MMAIVGIPIPSPTANAMILLEPRPELEPDLTVVDVLLVVEVEPPTFVAPLLLFGALEPVGELGAVDVAAGVSAEFAAPLSLADPVATPATAETIAVDVLVGCGLSSEAWQENITDLAL